MRVELVGFSQDVTLASKAERLNFFNFRSESGVEFRVPVSEEAMQLLLEQVYGDEPEERKEPEPLPDVDEGATVFGDENEVRPLEGSPEDLEGIVQTPENRARAERARRRYESARIEREEDVPSL